MVLLVHIPVVLAIARRILIAVIHAFFLDVNLSTINFGAIVRAFDRDIHFLRNKSTTTVGYLNVKIQWHLFTLRQIVGFAIVIQDKLVIVSDRTIPVNSRSHCQGAVISHQRDNTRFLIGNDPFHWITVFIGQRGLQFVATVRIFYRE